MKEGTLHDSHMLVYADAAFPVLHLSVVWRCSCRSSRKARLSQHRLESPSKSLRQPLSAQQTLRQPLLFFGGWLQGRRADAMSRLWSEPRLRRTPGGRSEDKYVTWWKLWDAREASWIKVIRSRKRLCKLFTLFFRFKNLCTRTGWWLKVIACKLIFPPGDFWLACSLVIKG